MRKGLNIPYVKEYNKYGEVTNPIKGSYVHYDSNRQERRESLQKQSRKNRVNRMIHQIGGCMGSNNQAIYFPRKKRAKDLIH